MTRSRLNERLEKCSRVANKWISEQEYKHSGMLVGDIKYMLNSEFQDVSHSNPFWEEVVKERNRLVILAKAKIRELRNHFFIKERKRFDQMFALYSSEINHVQTKLDLDRYVHLVLNEISAIRVDVELATHFKQLRDDLHSKIESKKRVFATEPNVKEENSQWNKSFERDRSNIIDWLTWLQNDLKDSVYKKKLENQELANFTIEVYNEIQEIIKNKKQAIEKY